MRMNMNHMKTIIWKELIEFKRSAKIYVVLTILFVIVMQVFASRAVMENTEIALEMKQILLGSSMLYIGLMCIPFLGCTLLARILYEERRENAVHILIANGIDTRIIWFGKMIVTYLVSYAVFVLATLLYYLIIYFFFGIGIRMTADTILMVYVIMPVLAFGVMAVIGLLYWVLKNPQMIGMIFPIFFTLGVWNLAVKYMDSFPTTVILLGALCIGLLLLAASVWSVNKVSKERITNI